MVSAVELSAKYGADDSLLGASWVDAQKEQATQQKVNLWLESYERDRKRRLEQEQKQRRAAEQAATLIPNASHAFRMSDTFFGVIAI